MNEPQATPRPLSGISVLDLSTTVAGLYCGRLLACAGADVVLVEPLGGSPMRERPPRSSGASWSHLFEHLNQGKGSIELSGEQSVDDERIAELAEFIDVVVQDAGSPSIATDPRVIVCTVADFPPGAYEGWRGTEMIHQALGGAMNTTGRADREPIYGVGERAAYATGTTAYIEILAALEARARDGRGDRVTATRYQSLAAMGQNLVSQMSFNGTSETRARYPGYLAILRCQDKWMALFAIRYWERLCEIFERPDLLEDRRYATQEGRLAGFSEISVALQESARAWRADDLVAELQAARISAATIDSLETLIESEQWQVRGVVTEVVDPATNRRSPALARVFEIDGVEFGPDTPAPQLADDRGFVERLLAGAPAAPTAPNASCAQLPDERGPLAGIRVLEFTTAWAGPFAGRCLANLGAQVIKVETASKLDSWRGPMTGGNPDFYPDRDPGPEAIDRSVLFCSQNLDKRSVGLDLKRPEAREILDELVKRSDIILANFKPGVLDRLMGGLDRIRAVNPGISIIEMPAFGPGGPISGHQGMGKTMEPAAGITALMDYGDGSAPVLTGPAFMDPTGGLHGAAAALTALALRRRTGNGCRIVAPQVEAAAHWIGEYVLQQIETGATWTPLGNAVPAGSPHDAYRAAGDDQWVVIAATTDSEWAALIEVMARPELTDDQRFGSSADRHQHSAELRSEIERWTSTRSKHEIAAQLQRVGVPAAPVLGGDEIAADPAMESAGMIVELDHPKVGRHRYSDMPFRFGRWSVRHRASAPVFAEANDWVLEEVLGLEPVEIDRLRGSGALEEHPGATSVESPHSSAETA